MRKPLLIGLPALVAATSCVPVAQAGSAPAKVAAGPAPVANGRDLLRQLDLDVPTDLQPAAPLAAALEGAPAFDMGAQTPDDAARARQCLTEAVYYEARSEPLDGQRAVAQVVLNRVRDRAFPASICGVVYQGHERRTGCQFSFTCDGSMDRPREPVAWARAEVVAQAALAGLVYAPVGAATYYHANYVSPWWAPSLTRIGAVGSHIFYRWRDAMEGALTFRQAYSGREPDAVAQAGGGEVAIHIGSDPDDQVTVHRGEAPTLADATAGAAPAAPRYAMTSGVRVHRGLDPNAGGEVADGVDGPYHRKSEIVPSGDQANRSET